MMIGESNCWQFRQCCLSHGIHAPSSFNILWNLIFKMKAADQNESVTRQPLLATLKGERQSVPPIWLMRQAGRYLPEYRALRAEKGGFLAMAMDPPTARDITLQPIRRFGFDGAILFSDILTIPMALGQKLWFEPGEGPRLAPALGDAQAIDALVPASADTLDPVYETVRMVAKDLPPAVTFLGFAGSPWTVATYMIAGQGSRTQESARRLAYAHPDAMGRLIERIVGATIDYLASQHAAGVQAVQLFDSWAGSLSPEQFERWVIAPNAAIVAALRHRCPGLIVIGFPKGAGGKLIDYAQATGVDAIGIDETVSPVWAARELPPGMPVQGNLDPLALIAGGDTLARAIDQILHAFADRPHVFNLGHGILPDTPIANVQALIERVRGR